MREPSINERMVAHMKRLLVTQGYSPQTRDTYIRWTQRFTKFLGHPHPRQIGTKEIASFLDHLANDRGLSAATRNQATAAIKYLMREVLASDAADSIKNSKGPKYVPTVLSHAEASMILREMSGQTREYSDSVADGLRQLVGFTYADGEDDAVMEALRTGFFGMPELQPELSVYDDLRSSGELALFSDASLRQALSAMRARIDRLLVYQADLLNVEQINVDPYLLRRFDLSELFRGRFEDLEIPTGQADSGTALTADMEARNLALFKLGMLTQFALRLDEVEGALLSVQQILVAQLERQPE